MTMNFMFHFSAIPSTLVKCANFIPWVDRANPSCIKIGHGWCHQARNCLEIDVGRGILATNQA
jgi:hypothetical protein